jgi:hypothetical protein
MRGFYVSLVFFIAIYVAFFAGLFAQLPGLMLAFLCAAPPLGIWLGRMSMRVHLPTIALLNEKQKQVLSQANIRQVR